MRRISIVLMLAFLAACGVKGDPLPPGQSETSEAL